MTFTFESARQAHLQAKTEGEISSSAAYYFFCEQSKKRGFTMDYSEFHKSLELSMRQRYNRISMEIIPPAVSQESLEAKLDTYYAVTYLYDKNGEVIGVL